MLQEFITSALIIDDKESEIQNLKNHLESKDIWVKHYTPDSLEANTIPLNNRKIIFLDLYLKEEDDIKSNLSIIRNIFTKHIGNDFGAYGIVLWSKHADEISFFIERIYKTANKYTPPLFVVPLDKNQFLRKGNFDGILDLLEQALLKDVSSSFFIEWNKAVKKGSDNTITTLYNLFDSNDKKSRHLESILYLLAANYTGIPKGNLGNYDLQKDLVKSLMDTLQFEITNNYENIESLFSKNPDELAFNETVEEKNKILSKLNSLLLLDFQNLSQKNVLPGNIYEIINSDLPLHINEFHHKGKELALSTHDLFKDKNIKRVCIELTPPCDFAQGKKQNYSRVVSGILLDYDKELLKGNASPFKSDNFYTFLYPVNIEGFENPQMVIFDFYRFQTLNEDELKNEKNYKIIMKAKDKLFADILQKLSSHTARLGIAVLYP